jgi:transcriptional regulator with XRE-family HTH domain
VPVAHRNAASTDGKASARGQDYVGGRLRAVRQARGLTLKAVATDAGLSESFLSQLERGVAGFSLSSLESVAAVLQLSLAELFAADDGDAPRVLTPETRPSVYVPGFGEKQLLTPPWPNGFEVWLCRLEVGGATSPELDTHGSSEEFLFVLSGVLELHLPSDVFRVEAGGSVAYRSSQPHRTVNVADQVSDGLWVIAPPTMDTIPE